MSEVQEEFAGLTATFKFGKGFEDPWIVVRALDDADLQEKLRALHEGETGKLVAALAREFHGLYVEDVKQPSRRAARDESALVDDDEEEERPTRRSTGPRSSTGRGGSDRGRTSSRNSRGPKNGDEHPEQLDCEECGEVLIYKGGVSKNTGKKYAFWTCPDQKEQGDGHSSEWAL